MKDKMKKRHHSDPIVGGTSEEEGRPWGQGEYANMPQQVRMQEYPKYGHEKMPELDDTMGRIDEDERYNERGERPGLDRCMY